MGQVRQREKEEVAPSSNDLLRLAAARLKAAQKAVALDRRRVWLKYSDEVDLLTIRFKENPRPSRSEASGGHGIIYNYEGSQLVSVEIINITGKYAADVA